MKMFPAERVEQGVGAFQRAVQVIGVKIDVKIEGLDFAVVMNGPELIGPRPGRTRGRIGNQWIVRLG